MKLKHGLSFLTVLFISFLFASCKHEIPIATPAPTNNGYPTAISNIITTRCAINGCHNAASYQGSGGILLDTWDHMFNGGNNGADVIPFAADNSSLLYFVNTYPELGITFPPTMPYQQVPNPQAILTRDEYEMMRNWVAAGAPDINGNIPFATNATTRQKIYVTMQGCDLIAVVDGARKVVMRYIPIGMSPSIESPHCVRFDTAGRYAYTCFYGGNYVQKIDVNTDTVVASLDIGIGSWNVVKLSPDGNHMIVSDWEQNGKIVLVNTQSMTLEQQYSGPNLFVYPHGLANNADFSMFYATAQYGNVVYKFSPSGYYKQVSLDGNPPATISSLDPHEIIMSPDYSKYFVTCQNSNEVRVMDANADTLIKVIPVGIKPQEFAISTTRPYLFVTCIEDSTPNAGFKGSVYAINYNTYEATRIDGQFYQPHGITVDDKNGVFYIVSENSNPNGPAPHHVSDCGGRDGYYNVYDLNTFQKLPRRYEVTADPYSADIRFK